MARGFSKPDTVRKYIKNINTASLERAGYHMNAHIPQLVIKRTFKSAAKLRTRGAEDTLAPHL